MAPPYYMALLELLLLLLLSSVALGWIARRFKFPYPIALVAGGRVDLDRLVTGTYGLDRAADALTAGRRDPQSVKVVVHPQL